MIDSRPVRVSSPVVQYPPSETTSPRPKDGSMPRLTEKMKMRRMPIRKVGSDMPARLIDRNSRDSQLCGYNPV